MISLRTEPEHSRALLDSLQYFLETQTQPVSGPDANTLDMPTPQKYLVHILDDLRGKGWKVDGPGNYAETIAWFRQLIDPKVKKQKLAWNETMLKWVEQGPPAVRACALEAIPLPLNDRSMEEDWQIRTGGFGILPVMWRENQKIRNLFRLC